MFLFLARSKKVAETSFQGKRNQSMSNFKGQKHLHFVNIISLKKQKQYS